MNEQTKTGLNGQDSDQQVNTWQCSICKCVNIFSIKSCGYCGNFDTTASFEKINWGYYPRFEDPETYAKIKKLVNEKHLTTEDVILIAKCMNLPINRIEVGK